MRKLTAILAGILLVMPAVLFAQDGWISMFDGKTLTGWKANEHPESWKVVDDAITVDGPANHLFWMVRECENCEFRAVVKLNHSGNSGIYFRTAFGPGFPKGYETQVENTSPDPQKTGSLYSYSKVGVQLVPDDTWLTQDMIANGNHIIIKVSRKTVADYVDERNTYTKGCLALQQHNPGSVVQYRNLMIRPLPAGSESVRQRMPILLTALGLAIAAAAEQFPITQPAPRELGRVNFHRVKNGPAPEPGAEQTSLISPLVRADGARVRNAKEWYRSRRPELVRQWTAVLGKIAPAPEDLQWFGDVRKAVDKGRSEQDGYTRIDLDIPIERDFYQHHLLLVPKGQGAGPFPAVIAWSSSSPDYREPEAWWGAYLARHGFVVLTSWSFIRSYRDGTRLKEATELVYQRFGHWLGLGKMVHDTARETEYLRSRPEVDGKRIGFIGFSLGAKAAVYAAAFNPDIKVTVAVDPHIALNGGTNWFAPWYLDWQRKFDDIHTSDYPIPELRGTVQSLLNPDVKRPGFERDHHELLALTAPRAFLLIGGSLSEDAGGDSDDLESWGYFNRAKEVYRFLGVPERLQFCSTSQGHQATGAQIDPAWQAFLRYFLQEHPIRFEGYR